MKRRDILRSGAAAVMAGFGPGLARAGAALGCYQGRAGEVSCAVGFPDAPEIAALESRADCWAGCLAYVLEGYGARISAASVLRRMERAGTGGDARAIMAAAGYWTDDAGRRFWLSVRRLGDIRRSGGAAGAIQPLVDTLRRRPLIVGVTGHSMVLTEMRFSDAPFAPMRRGVLTLRDPWTGTANLRKLAAEEAPERLFAIDIRIRRA
ncbi:hypothetical protein [Poseidonocella sp. HB161398]|uniref:hypothetical protein n=1 Tax=Poseidonocella sp. HB161398 TaxID=2320855 RepID=UPI0011086960|nr:hypothetical protein [Poseidonocella sp. HB161398]